ncbi:MAG TPA: Rid family hydrolase [Hyphomonadaceae bacterium]|jgi:enamine deaminase RidA (YjgF/YER057c/UK114 family)|nr:Rid family hydrolase [Hyphomonadaceae bacterium]
MRALAGIALIALSACATPAPPGEIKRAYATATAAFAKSIVIPPGYETIRLPGMVADPVTPAANGQPASYGDTETQTESILRKIAAALSELGASEGDVVAMTVYLVAPAPGQPMDFAGMMRAYSRHYGNAMQPNRPVRSTVQVDRLVAPGLLVEIEVTAARKP